MLAGHTGCLGAAREEMVWRRCVAQGIGVAAAANPLKLLPLDWWRCLYCSETRWSSRCYLAIHSHCALYHAQQLSSIPPFPKCEKAYCICDLACVNRHPHSMRSTVRVLVTISGSRQTTPTLRAVCACTRSQTCEWRRLLAAIMLLLRILGRCPALPELPAHEHGQQSTHTASNNAADNQPHHQPHSIAAATCVCCGCGWGYVQRQAGVEWASCRSVGAGQLRSTGTHACKQSRICSCQGLPSFDACIH